MKMFNIAAVLAATASYAAADGMLSTCYAVAFSSGDETAAYQAGVIKGLGASDPSRVNYQAVSGVSGGAISAGILGSYPEG